MTRIVLAAAALFLIGCTTTPVNTETRAVIKSARIGVVSLQGSTFFRIYKGVTVFGNEQAAVQVGEWKIDEVATQALERELSKKGYETVTRLALGEEAPDSFYIKNKYDNPSPDLNIGKLLDLAKSQEIGILAVVQRTRGNSEDPIENSVRGSFGEFHKNLFGVKLTCAYSMVRIAFINVTTSKAIAATSTLPCSGGYDNLPEWRASFDEYSTSEKELIQSLLIKRINAQIEKGVADLKL